MKVQSIAVVAMRLLPPPWRRRQRRRHHHRPSPPAATTTPAGDLKFYTHQPSEMRASKLIGTKVRNNANENIGDVQRARYR
jgi:hypothetical protein